MITSRSVLEIIVDINRILTKLCCYKLGVPLIMEHHEVFQYGCCAAILLVGKDRNMGMVERP